MRDPIVGGTAALTVLATWSLWGEVVKGGDNYILTETGAIIRLYVARKQGLWLMYQRRVATFILYAILLVRVSRRRKRRDRAGRKPAELETQPRAKAARRRGSPAFPEHRDESAGRDVTNFQGEVGNVFALRRSRIARIKRSCCRHLSEWAALKQAYNHQTKPPARRACSHSYATGERRSCRSAIGKYARIKAPKCRGVAQPGSAPALGAGGLRFKSGRPDH